MPWSIIQAFAMHVTHPMRKADMQSKVAPKAAEMRCFPPAPVTVTGVFTGPSGTVASAAQQTQQPISASPSPSGKSGDDVFFLFFFCIAFSVSCQLIIHAVSQSGLVSSLVCLQANQTADPTIAWAKKKKKKFGSCSSGKRYLVRCISLAGPSRFFFPLLPLLLSLLLPSPAISFKPDNEVAL